MVHSFKFGGQRVAYDSVSGAIIPLSELAFKMLDYIELPMPKDCPSALRYDLAKYDSAAISDTYDEMYALYQAGKLFAEQQEPLEASSGAILQLGERSITHQAPSLLARAKDMADAGEAVSLKAVPAEKAEEALTEEDLPAVMKEMEKLAKEQVKRMRGEGGRPFTAFEKREICLHEEAACAGCWAKKHCSLAAPHGVMCELERKRIECVMMVEVSAKEV